MKRHISILAIAIMMATILLQSCSLGAGKGDLRDRNLHRALIERLDTVPGVEYIGMTDTRSIANDTFQTVIIYFVTDTITGDKAERNARVTTNDDCSVIYAWEDLDCQVLDEVKRQVSDKLREKGIPMDDSIIDALIKLKRR